MKDVTEIIVILLRLVEAVAITFLIPWVKSKVDASKLDKAKTFVKIGVQAAEMIAPAMGWNGEKKKEYVEGFIIPKFYELGWTYDSETVNNMIESAVLELNRAI